MEHRPHMITKSVINNITEPTIFNIEEFNDWTQKLCKYVLMQAATQEVRRKNSELGLLCEIHLEGEMLEVRSKWSERLQSYVIDTAGEDYHFMANVHKTNSLMFIRTSSDNSGLALNDILNLISTNGLFVIVVVGNNGEISFAYKTIKDTPQYRRIYHDMQSNLASVEGKKELLEKIKKSPGEYGLEIGFAGEDRKRRLAKVEHISLGYIGPDEYDDYILDNPINFCGILFVPYCSAISTNIKEGESYSTIYATEDEFLTDQATARRYLLRGEEIPAEIDRRLHENYLEIKDYV